ncbi:unnamed protein product [Owenia fusiformis]|uniref:Intradiol ring-cleavage dioxygenases domain-containing protein n=1 Tax=Owenia fusiformis TaxID=6347 RepID=A0A8J1UK22_OWEFU|nr:unnamed protein product [Owenia fusiformis]
MDHYPRVRNIWGPYRDSHNDDFKVIKNHKDLTDAVSEHCEPTQEDLLGPFFKPDTAENNHICMRYKNYTILPKISIKGYVKNVDCDALSGAKIEIWQADEEGGYHNDNTCRGYILSDENGFYNFETIHPGRYVVNGQFRPAHIHIFTTKPGYHSLVTQIYFENDPYLGVSDACPPPYCHSNDPHRTISLETVGSTRQSEGFFDIVLDS